LKIHFLCLALQPVQWSESIYEKLINLSADDAREHFLKGGSYFNGDFPDYISFEPILRGVADILDGGDFTELKHSNPELLSGVNYSFVANKDGRFAWRPYELMHPAIYVSLVNLLCSPENWSFIRSRLGEFEGGVVTCCSSPVLSLDHQTDQAAQVSSWWQAVEQRSLELSLEFSHMLHTDVADCYALGEGVKLPTVPSSSPLLIPITRRTDYHPQPR
jgi:hypothetical protein